MEDTPQMPDSETPVPTPAPVASLTPSPGQDIPPAPLGFGTRLGLLFSSPAKLGDEVREHPAWFGPLLLGLVLTLIGTAVIPAEVFVEANRAAAAGTGQELPAFMQGAFFKYAALGGITIFWFVMNLITAGLVTLVFAFVMGDEGRFKQYLAAAAWASVIAGAAALVLSPLRVITRDPQLSLGLGTFAELVMDGGYPLRLAKMVDFFSLWSWAVLGAVASRFDKQRSIGSGITVMLVIMLSILSVIAIFLPDT